MQFLWMSASLWFDFSFSFYSLSQVFPCSLAENKGWTCAHQRFVRVPYWLFQKVWIQYWGKGSLWPWRPPVAYMLHLLCRLLSCVPYGETYKNFRFIPNSHSKMFVLLVWQIILIVLNFFSFKLCLFLFFTVVGLFSQTIDSNAHLKHANSDSHIHTWDCESPTNATFLHFGPCCLCEDWNMCI